MKTLQEQFVPYNLAVKLMKLGLNKDCFYMYENYGNNLKPISNFQDSDLLESQSLAPLWQQAFDWFRENYNHSGEVYHYSSGDFGKWHFDIEPLKLDGERYTTPVKEGYENYQKARQACLEKLIEILDNEKP